MKLTGSTCVHLRFGPPQPSAGTDHFFRSHEPVEVLAAEQPQLDGRLAQGCALYVHCRFDGNAVFNTAFTTSDVSTRDYFHPSLAGQTKLALVTWNAGYDFSDSVAPVTSASSATTATGTDVTLTATDNVGVSGIEYKLGGAGYSRYTATVSVPSGITLTYRAVDVNGNTEASHSLVG